MSDLKTEMLKIKVKGYFDNGDLRIDPSITVFVHSCPVKLFRGTNTGIPRI